MVYAFFVGLTLGLPLGCYLREQGYASKLKNAYHVFVPPPDAHQSDKFKNTNKQFYDNIKKGQVDHTEFERYIYGGTYAKRSQDNVDKVEEEVNKQMRDYKY